MMKNCVAVLYLGKSVLLYGIVYQEWKMHFGEVGQIEIKHGASFDGIDFRLVKVSYVENDDTTN